MSINDFNEISIGNDESRVELKFWRKKSQFTSLCEISIGNADLHFILKFRVLRPAIVAAIVTASAAVAVATASRGWSYTRFDMYTVTVFERGLGTF